MVTRCHHAAVASWLRQRPPIDAGGGQAFEDGGARAGEDPFEQATDRDACVEVGAGEELKDTCGHDGGVGAAVSGRAEAVGSLIEEPGQAGGIEVLGIPVTDPLEIVGVVPGW